MNNQLFFVLKVIFLSTLISILIKYGGRLLPISANNYLAIIVVILPSLILALMLWFRSINKTSIT